MLLARFSLAESTGAGPYLCSSNPDACSTMRDPRLFRPQVHCTITQIFLHDQTGVNTFRKTRQNAEAPDSHCLNPNTMVFFCRDTRLIGLSGALAPFCTGQSGWCFGIPVISHQVPGLLHWCKPRESTNARRTECVICGVVRRSRSCCFMLFKGGQWKKDRKKGA